MPSSTTTGLATAIAIYEDRGKIARELSARGKAIMGYYCSYPPLEMITAAGFEPFRVQGSMEETITKADLMLPTIICPMIRSSMDLAMKGKYDFLSGFVGAHTCDCTERLCRIWKSTIELPYFHYIDMPHVLHAGAIAQFKEKINLFRQSLEEHTGQKITDEMLNEQIRLHNRQRRLVRELYRLRRQDPPLITGGETLRIMIALMCMPIGLGSQMLEEIIEEAQTRTHKPRPKSVRLFLWGTPLTEAGLIDMIENELDAVIVMDDTCVGSRHFWPDVGESDDPVDALARRYLGELRCPRTFRETTGNRADDLEERFGYLRDFAADWRVDGVLLQSMRYCDTHGYEIPAIQDFFENMGLSSIYIEHEYTHVATAPVKTRVEAFIETISM